MVIGEVLQCFGAELLALFDDFFSAFVIPADGVQDGVALAGGEPDVVLAGGFCYLPAKFIEVGSFFAADKLHQLLGGVVQLAEFVPVANVGQAALAGGVEADALLFAPAGDGVFLTFYKVFFVHLLPVFFPQPFHHLAHCSVETQRRDALGRKTGAAAIGALDADLVIAEVGVVEHAGGNANGLAVVVQVALDVGQVLVGPGNLLDVFGGQLAVFVAQVFAQLAVQGVGGDEHDLAPAAGGVVVGKQPDGGGDAGVVEQVVGQLNDVIVRVVFAEVAGDIGCAAAGIAGEQAGTVVHRGNARTQRAGVQGLHLADHFHEKQQLAVAGARGGVHGFAVAPIVGQLNLKARIDDVPAVLDVFDLAAPAFAVGRIGQHEVEAPVFKFVGGQGGADADVFGAVALDHHVGFADGVGLVVDFLAEQIHVAAGGNAVGRILDVVLRFGQHAARAAGGVINGDHRRQLVADGVEHQVGHQMDDFARGEMLTGFFVVFFVEAANQLLEDIAHAQVGQAGQGISIRVGAVVGREVDAR